MDLSICIFLLSRFVFFNCYVVLLFAWKTKKCKWTSPCFPMFPPFWLSCFSPIDFASGFFQFWSFAFWFSMCFPLFGICSSLKIITISYWGEHNCYIYILCTVYLYVYIYNMICLRCIPSDDLWIMEYGFNYVLIGKYTQVNHPQIDKWVIQHVWRNFILTRNRETKWTSLTRYHMYYKNLSDVIFTLWLFNITMENGPFIDDFPS